MTNRTAQGRFAPAPKLIRTNIYLTAEQHAAATDEAAKTGRTLAQVIREWIEKGRK